MIIKKHLAILALNLLHNIHERKVIMPYTVEKLLRNTLTALEIGYRVVRGIDYQTMSQYILKINQHKDIDSILHEVSRCFKDILDYELLGFFLKDDNSSDFWVDPRLYSDRFSEFVARDLNCQNIDFNAHYFENNPATDCRNFDAKDINKLISYKIIDGTSVARLYILPGRKMLHYHEAIISTIISSISIALEKNLNIKQLENAAAIDPLTNCYNRRALSTFIENDIAYTQRYGNSLSIIMLDMDDFKVINDRYGHQAGDTVLKEITSLLPSLMRKSDYLARYGGEEFVLVLPDTPLYNAVQLAEKLRKAIERYTIDLGDRKSIAITASFGVACLENKRDGNSLMREADERLYQAKSMGKNTVVPSLLPCFADRRFVTNALKNGHTGTAQVA